MAFNSVGERIKKIREIRGFSQKQLGELTGIHEVLIRRYEYGDRNPKTPQLQKIADALDVHINALKEPQIISYEDLMFSLFEIEDSFGDIEFHVHGGKVFMGIDNQYANHKLLEWIKNKENLSKEEYASWKMNYPQRMSYSNGKSIKVTKIGAKIKTEEE